MLNSCVFSGALLVKNTSEDTQLTSIFGKFRTRVKLVELLELKNHAIFKIGELKEVKKINIFAENTGGRINRAVELIE